MTLHLPLLTESRLKTYRRCPREERLRYQDGLLTGRSAALEFGTLMHGALEQWWRHDLGAVEHWLAEQQGDAYDIAKCWALMRGYDARWFADKERFDVIAVEVEFRAPLVNPLTGAESRTWELAGKIDVVVREIATGDVLIIEHKTSSEDIAPGASYWVRLRMDGQISCYFVGADSLGNRPTACLYDVIGKPQQRPYEVSKKREKAETPEEYGERIFAAIAEDPDRYYQRSRVVRLEDELREWQLDTWQLATQMRDAKRMGIAPKNPDQCVRFGSQCGYLPLCAGETNASTYRHAEWKHPELTPHFAASSKEEMTNGNATDQTEAA